MFKDIKRQTRALVGIKCRGAAMFLAIVFFVLPSSLIAQQTSPLSNYNPGPSKQYQRVLVPLIPVTDTALVNIQQPAEKIIVSTTYTDALGRPLQKVTRQASPLKKDLVEPVYYDNFGLPSVQYMAYVQQDANADDGLFKANALVKDSAFYKSFFPNENYNYSKTFYDASPLNKVIKQTAPGNLYTGAGRGKTIEERANSTEDSVRLWTIAINNEEDVPVSTLFYIPGSLWVTEVTDEQGIKSVSYKNEQGRLILIKQQVSATPATGHSGWLCTYYIYDEAENLRAVIPPKAVEVLQTVNWSFASAPTLYNGLCYKYYYDNKNRQTVKQVPGAGKTYTVYDEWGRICMQQDARLKLTSQWTFILYDAQSRPVKTGLITSALPYQDIVSAASASSNYPVLSGTYSILKESFYDDYSWLPANGNPFTAGLTTTHINSTNFNMTAGAAPDYAEALVQSNKTRGMLTGSKTLVLNSSTYLFTLPVYDVFGRCIQTKSTNITGGTDVGTMQYSYSGKVLSSHIAHQKSGTPVLNYNVLTKMSYDHAARVTAIQKNINGTGLKTISSFSYNELGQVKQKQLLPNAGSALEYLNYDYDIQGRNIGVNRNFIKDQSPSGGGQYFGYELAYDNNQNVLAGQTYAGVFYNGQIAGATWKSRGDGEKRKYDYNYDHAGRLLKADFTQFTGGSFNQAAGLNFSVKMGDGITYTSAYDAAGNIRQMQQWGFKAGVSVQIDNLSYNYIANSNQLLNVIDANNQASTLLGDFRTSALHPVQTKTSATVDYTYDANGNLLKDLNKDIGNAGTDGIVYNFMNLAESITIRKDAGGANIKGTIEYTYDAAGVKLMKKVTEGSAVTTTTYIGGFVYQKRHTSSTPGNDTLQFIAHEEGRFREKSPGVWVSDYMLRDHLGNVRMVITEETKQNQYPAATMETGSIATQELYYANLSATQADKPAWFNDPALEDANNKVAKLKNDGVSQKIGPAILLKVMAGDSYNIRVVSGWNSGSTPTQGTNDIATLLLNALSGGLVQQGVKATATELQNGSSGLSTAITGFLNNQPAPGVKPKAYINWILLDEQFKYSGGGAEVVGNSGVSTIHTKSNLTVPKNGYLYIYTSNESSNIDVFFDNLQVTHTSGHILEETHYYPFGLVMAGISTKALGITPKNVYKFNGGVELEEEIGLNYCNTFYRKYDAQVGRFTGVDMLAEKFFDINPYQFAFNNPITFNDPLGDQNKAPGRSVKGPDGNYHTGWVSEMMWNEKGFFNYGEVYGFSGGDFGSSHALYNIRGMSSQSFLNQKQSLGDNAIWDVAKGQFGYWSTNSFDPRNNGYQEGAASGDQLQEVVVGTKKTWVAYQQSNGGGVGQPGEWESIIPVWGSGRAAIDHFQNGNYWRGLGYTALAISDVFLVKSIATGIGRGAWKLGSHSWGATRKWMVNKGYAGAGEPLHHWAVTQATARKYGLEAVTNQPWNLVKFPNQSLHMRAGHGMNYLGQPGYGIMGQFWYGTPTWFKAGIISGGGRIVD